MWATAPLLHNNTLGIYNHDPSVAGRLAAFDDAIGKLFYRSKRAAGSEGGYAQAERVREVLDRARRELGDIFHWAAIQLDALTPWLVV